MGVGGGVARVCAMGGRGEEVEGVIAGVAIEVVVEVVAVVGIGGVVVVGGVVAIRLVAVG